MGTVTTSIANASVLTDPIVLPGIWSLSVPGALVGLVVILVLMLATNRLYTKGQHDEIVVLLHEKANLYKASSEKWEAAYTSSDEQNRELVSSAGITKELFQKADLKMEGGDDAVEATE